MVLLHLDHPSVSLAQGQLIAPYRDLHRIAQGGHLADVDGDTLGNAHIHNPALDRALTVELDNGHRIAYDVGRRGSMQMLRSILAIAAVWGHGYSREFCRDWKKAWRFGRQMEYWV